LRMDRPADDCHPKSGQDQPSSEAIHMVYL
jgi:hypothetical protein